MKLNRITVPRLGFRSASFDSTFVKSKFHLRNCRQFSITSTAPYNFSYLFEQPNKKETTFIKLEDLSSKVVECQFALTRSSKTNSLSIPLSKKFTCVPSSCLTALAKYSFCEINHFLHTSHLEQLSRIIDDPEASDNDRFVAFTLLKNANIAAGKVFPGCQDTGTAIIIGKKGQDVFVVPDNTQSAHTDDDALSLGVYEAYTTGNLRYSQVSPLDMFKELNTKCNLPAQIDLYTSCLDTQVYELAFIAKGGGSANKTFLYQETKSLLNESSLQSFLEENIRKIGTSACPPYHLAVVIGGLSAEMTLKTVKLASCRYLDGLSTTGSSHAVAFRDLEWEEKLLNICREIGIGAQFGGKYFCHDVRVIRLPRHGASCPVGIGVSCSADRQILTKISPDGVFIEKLEHEPSQYLPDNPKLSHDAVKIDMRGKSIEEIVQILDSYTTSQRVLLTGSLIVMRDIAHAKIKEIINMGGELPEYVQKYPLYYAGPAKTPEGEPSGSFGPTTAGRMDSYADLFMKMGGSRITIAKGNRSKSVVDACKNYSGFYLGSVGGPAAVLATECIKKVQVEDFGELGMEAVWRIEVEDFPAFIIIDNKGNDFYRKWLK